MYAWGGCNEKKKWWQKIRNVPQTQTVDQSAFSKSFGNHVLVSAVSSTAWDLTIISLGATVGVGSGVVVDGGVVGVEEGSAVLGTVVKTTVVVSIFIIWKKLLK